MLFLGLTCRSPDRNLRAGIRAPLRFTRALDDLHADPRRLLQTGQTIITFEMLIGAGFSMIPPGTTWAAHAAGVLHRPRPRVALDLVEVLDDDSALARARRDDATLLAASLPLDDLDQVALIDFEFAVAITTPLVPGRRSS